MIYYGDVVHLLRNAESSQATPLSCVRLQPVPAVLKSEHDMRVRLISELVSEHT